MSPDNTYKEMAVENAGRILFCAVDFKFAKDAAVKLWFQEGGLSKWVVPEALPTSRFAYEVAWRVVLGDLPPKRVPSVLQAAGVSADDSRKETGYVLGDSIVVVDAEIDQIAAKSGGSGLSPDEVTAATAMAQAGKQKLKDMANELILAEMMTVQQLAEVAETEFLLEGGYTFTKQPQFKGKVIRVNTKLMYTQTKFNLLAEESEGYAKVATLLGQEGTITEDSLESAKRTIQSLIGFFDLDPYRVLDITMDSFEMNPGHSILLNIISMFKRSGRAQVLGFKFQYYQREQVAQATPQSLYRLAGRLIKEDLVDIDALWPHLTPGDEEGVEEYQTWIKERVAEANRYGVVNLASTEATGAEAEQVAPVNQNVDVSRPAAFEEEGVKQQEGKLGRHQKLGLLEGLLHADDWTRAQMVLERLAGLAPLSWPPVAKALCRAVTLNLTPLYSATQLPYLSGKKSSSAAAAPNDETPSSFHLSEAVVIPPRVVNMLLTLGPYLYRDGALFTKVCRSLRAHILTAAYGFPLPNFHVSAVYGVVQDGVIDGCTPGLQSAIRTAATVLEKVLLPALMVTPANPAMSFEVWEVLKLLPYELRYELYGNWDSVGAGNKQEDFEKWPPMLIFARKFANVEARKILRRVADIKDKAFQQHELLLNKLTHANPMVTLSSIVKQMENYTAMIPAAIAAFKGLNYLEHEIVEYLILQALAQKRDRLKDSGLDIADWLQHLAEFVGSWGKKHHSVINLHGLLQMMVKQAINGQPWDLVILQEMLGQMANVRIVEDTQEDLQEAMAGGEKLYFEAFNIGSMKLTKNETKTVNKALVKLKETLYPSPEDAPRLAMPLLIGIAQLRNRILYEADPFSLPTPNVKVTGGQYDMLHKIFIQLYEYLVKAVPEAEFASLVPPLNELVHSYHLEPEVAMLIYRPVLQDLKLKPAPKLARPSEANGDASGDAATDWTTEPSDDNELAVNLGDVKLTWKRLLETVQSFHAPPTWHIMSPLLYLRFWSLSLSDIYVPKARYLSEIEKVQKAAKDAAKEAESLTGSEQKKRDREAKFLRDTVTNLENELAAQEKSVEAVKQILVQEKEQWQVRPKRAADRASAELTSADQAAGDRAADGRFPNADLPEKRTAISDFFQTCIFPRVTLSLPDALFCFHFLSLLHEINAPGLPTTQVITFVLVRTLGPLVALCSEYEALRYGKFLGKLLRLLQHWKSNEETFQRECGSEPHLRSTGKEKASKFLDYQEQVFRWHQWLTRLIGRHLDSKDPMRIRNSLVVLKELKDIFPAVKKHAKVFEAKLEKLINGKETTEDILIIARSYKGILIQKQNQMVAPHVFNPKLEPPPARESTPASGRSVQPSLPPKASPLGPSRPPSGKPAAASGVTKRESASDPTAVDQSKPAVNGVSKEAKAGEGREQKLERVEGSPARAAPGREETSTPGSRLNPNAKPFAPKDEPKAKADREPEDRRSKRQEWRPKEAKVEPKVEPKPEDTEQEEGEISATPDRKHEPEFEEEPRARVPDARKESPVRRESPARKERESAPPGGEKVPLGKLLATVNRRESVPDRGAPERTVPRGPAPLPPLKKDKDGGRDVSTAREREGRGKEGDAGRSRDSDVSRSREGDVGRGPEAAREGLKPGRESGESRGIPRSESKDGLRDVVSEREGLKAREPVTAAPPGFPPRSRPSSGTAKDQAEGRAGERLASGVSERLGSLKEGKAPPREVEKRSKEAEPRRGPVKDEVEGRDSRKALLREAPAAEMGPKVAEGRFKGDESDGKRVKGETRVSERSNNGREVIDARARPAPVERKLEALDRKGSGVLLERKLGTEERKAGGEERNLGGEERKLSGGLEERRGPKIISLSGRSKAVREEGEIPERPDVHKRLSASPADRRTSEEGGKRDRGKRPSKDDREEPERERKRHKHDSDAHPSDQRQVVRSLAAGEPPRRVVLTDDHPRRAVPEELPRRGGFDDRVRSSVEEPRRGGYEDRGRFLPDDDGRGMGVREVVESARAPYREFRASEEAEERHRRKEPPAELRRRGPDGERTGRSFSPVPERGGITGRLERVERDEEATRLREQLLKKQMERTGAKSTAPPPTFEPSRKKGKSGEPHAVMSVAAMELNEDLVEGPSRPSRTERHHRHERHEKSEEKRGRSRDYDDGEHERKKQERRGHGKKRRHE